MRRIVYDLDNIMAVISANVSGMCGSLVKKVSLSADERDMIDDIVKSSRRLIEIGV